MIRSDIITEFEFGKGAIKTCGKFLIQEVPGRKTLVAGLLVESLISDTKSKEGSCEMWEGEIIFIPKRKYIQNKTEKNFWALGIDQKLLGYWGHAKYWKKKIFDKQK